MHITYDRQTMVGPEVVVIRGTTVLYVDGTVQQGTPEFRAGSISQSQARALVRTVTRTGVFCLAGEYTDRFVITLSEPVSEELTIRVRNNSRTVSVTSGNGRGGPRRVRAVIGEVRAIGRGQPVVERTEFCRRTAVPHSETVSQYCNTTRDPADTRTTGDRWRPNPVRRGGDHPLSNSSARRALRPAPQLQSHSRGRAGVDPEARVGVPHDPSRSRLTGYPNRLVRPIKSDIAA